MDAGVLAGVEEEAERVARRLVAVDPDAERLVAVGGRPGRPGHGVGRAVEHGGPHLAGVQLGVGHADQAAVRVAGERQLIVADGSAEQVEVAGHVGRADVVEQLAVAAGAGPAESAGCGGGLPYLIGRDRERWQLTEEHLLRLRVGEASHRRALADAAGVEADDVEAGLDGGGDDVVDVTVHELDHRVARAAVVDEERADAVGLVGGRQPGQRQRDVVAPGAVVVERDGGGRALAARRRSPSRRARARRRHGARPATSPTPWPGRARRRRGGRRRTCGGGSGGERGASGWVLSGS